MSKCKKCGMEIQWNQQNGKWVPYSNGMIHFEFCKKPITESTVMSMSAGWQRGEKYYDCKCDCGVPPWEVCKHSFDNQKVGAHKTA